MIFKHKPEYLNFMPMEYDVLGKYLARFPEFAPLKKCRKDICRN